MVTEGWILVPVLLGLGVLAVLARPVDGRRIELDVRTVAGVRVLAATTAAVVLVGIGVSQIVGTGMQDRYAAVVFPLAALVAAYGLLAFGDPRIRVGVLVVVAVLGLAGGVRGAGVAHGVGRDRLGAAARPRGRRRGGILPRPARPRDRATVAGRDAAGGLPGSRSARFVDWRDYADRNVAASPAEFAVG